MGIERRAVATLLYDESFVDGALALGASIKAHLREKDVDLVTLATSGVPRGARQRLASGGWALHDVAAASRPSDTHVSNSRLRFAYSKLELWRLPYDVVVYADADAIALGPVDALFGCRASLCAVLRHGELLNSGVLVVRPDARVFEDMRAQADALPSYTGGDQGFLNSYYGNFAACPAFEGDGDDVARCRRLPNAWNGDWPLLWARGVDDAPNILHYSLGPASTRAGITSSRRERPFLERNWGFSRSVLEQS